MLEIKSLFLLTILATASLTLFVLSLVAIVVLFSLWKTTVAYSHFVFHFVPPVLHVYSPVWQSRSSSIADPPLGLAAELLLSWDSICRPQLSDCMRWFMWERGTGNPAGIKIQKTAMQCSLHILNYSAEHVASLIICLFLLMIKNAYFNYNLPSVHSICPSNIYFFTNCCV